MPTRARPDEMQLLLGADAHSVYILTTHHSMDRAVKPEFLLSLADRLERGDELRIHAGPPDYKEFGTFYVKDLRRDGVVLMDPAAMSVRKIEVKEIGGPDRFLTCRTPMAKVKVEMPKDPRVMQLKQQSMNPDDIEVAQVSGQKYALMDEAGQRISQLCSHEECIAKVDALRPKWTERMAKLRAGDEDDVKVREEEPAPPAAA